MLHGKNIIVTGATGLIGESLTRYLLKKKCNVLVATRNTQKATELFGDTVKYYEYNFSSGSDFAPDFKADYIFHLASPTTSRFFVEHPEETYNTIVRGTESILKYAKLCNAESMVYASSMEIYGEITKEIDITEDIQGYIAPDAPRSSYPLGKRDAEKKCMQYAKEQGVHVKIARLAQTIGNTIPDNDNRLIAQIVRGIKAGEDFVMHTSGESSACRVHVDDAIEAMIILLQKGTDGEAYNIANENTYCSVKEMAECAYRAFAPHAKVVIRIDNTTCFPPTTHLKLCTTKIQQLGWQPTKNLIEMFTTLVKR